MKRIETSLISLHDPALATLLHEAFDDDPALADSAGRTERIMRVVLASDHARKRGDQSRSSLRDPALSTLLHAAYDDQPALADSPGRTERIMRVVLASGVRPKSSPWVFLGWSSGAVATAAAVLMLALALGHRPPVPVPPGGARPPVIVAHPLPSPSVKVAPRQGASTLAKKSGTVTAAKQPPVLPAPDTSVVVRAPKRVPPATTPSGTPRHENPVTEPEAEHVAVALYSAGTAAHDAGDYESSYIAFRDSYNAVPTPEALLASGEALLQLSDQSADSAG